MSPGVRRLLFGVAKWVFVPLALCLAGYWLVGPYVLPRLGGLFLPNPGGQAGSAPRGEAAGS